MGASRGRAGQEDPFDTTPWWARYTDQDAAHQAQLQLQIEQALDALGYPALLAEIAQTAGIESTVAFPVLTHLVADGKVGTRLLVTRHLYWRRCSDG